MSASNCCKLYCVQLGLVPDWRREVMSVSVCVCVCVLACLCFFVHRSASNEVPGMARGGQREDAVAKICRIC